MAVLAEFLKTLRVGEPQNYENLTVFPLVKEEFNEPGYILLDRALSQGLLEVQEMSESGSVNEILVRNKCGSPVLILDGEILMGAKQNRVVNATTLVGPNMELKIQVSCVEQRRWRYVAEKFTESRHFSYANLRAKKSTQVAECLMSFGAFAADQGAIWDEVDRKQRVMGAESDTRAVNDVYESHEETLKKYREAIQIIDGQVGAAVYINGRFTCLDAFDSQVSLEELYKKMVESYALDALEQVGKEKKKIGKDVLPKLLERAVAAEVAGYPSAGLGEDLRISARGLVGSCLTVDSRVIHLALFAGADVMADAHNSPLSRPSRRRRTRV